MGAAFLEGYGAFAPITIIETAEPMQGKVKTHCPPFIWGKADHYANEKLKEFAGSCQKRKSEVELNTVGKCEVIDVANNLATALHMAKKITALGETKEAV